MVCLGNICRSPLAHGIMEARIRDLGLEWTVDSCGTSGWHVGEQPDGRSIQVAKENGIDLSTQRSRQFRVSDYDDFDHLIAMDASNYTHLKAAARNQLDVAKLSLLLNYLYPGENRQVPDPYYSGGFDYVFELISEAIDAFIKDHYNV